MNERFDTIIEIPGREPIDYYYIKYFKVTMHTLGIGPFTQPNLAEQLKKSFDLKKPVNDRIMIDAANHPDILDDPLINDED